MLCCFTTTLPQTRPIITVADHAATCLPDHPSAILQPNPELLGSTELLHLVTWFLHSAQTSCGDWCRLWQKPNRLLSHFKYSSQRNHGSWKEHVVHASIQHACTVYLRAGESHDRTHLLGGIFKKPTSNRWTQSPWRLEDDSYYVPIGSTGGL